MSVSNPNHPATCACSQCRYEDAMRDMGLIGPDSHPSSTGGASKTVKHVLDEASDAWDEGRYADYRRLLAMPVVVPAARSSGEAREPTKSERELIRRLYEAHHEIQQHRKGFGAKPCVCVICSAHRGYLPMTTIVAGLRGEDPLPDAPNAL